MDNDWAFPEEEGALVSGEEDAAGPPGSASSSEGEAPTKRKRGQVSFLSLSCNLSAKPAPSQYDPIKKWKLRYRSLWLDELVRGEGRGDHAGNVKCACGHPKCAGGIAETRCKDCQGCEGLALDCIVREHERNPLHRIQARFFYLI
jgi:hypothetical protein